jgi:hypothetical protein
MHSGIRRLWTWGVIPVVLAIPLALFASFAALSHNTQEEFCAYVAAGATGNYTSQGSPCNIDWQSVSLVFGSWFVAQMIVFTIIHAFWISARRKRAL